eukprot:6286993-Amphidinium_carterae.1
MSREGKGNRGTAVVRGPGVLLRDVEESRNRWQEPKDEAKGTRTFPRKKFVEAAEKAANERRKQQAAAKQERDRREKEERERTEEKEKKQVAENANVYIPQPFKMLWKRA